jgi:hypothetical protein
MCQDLEDIAAWIEAIRKVMSHVDQGISVSGAVWNPPVMAPPKPPPIALPKCLWAWTSPNPPATIADLVQALAHLRNWAAALGETLGCLPGDTPIPPAASPEP